MECLIMIMIYRLDHGGKDFFFFVKSVGRRVCKI